MNRHTISGPAQPAVLSLPLSEGDSGVAQTVAAMRQLIDHGKKDPACHERAAWILHAYHVRSFDFDGELRAIFHWVKENIRWTRDPTGKEGLHSAAEILRLRIGDCDDFSILVCSLLGTVGHRTRLITISNHADDPETFSHIYPEVQLENGKWLPMDGGRRNPGFGKGPRRFFRRHVWDVDQDEDFEDSPNAGLGALGMMRRRHSRLGWATPFARPSPAGRVPQPGIRGLRGIGQDDGSSFDWSQFETELPALTTAVTTGTANIIRASNAPQVAAANPYAILAQQNPAALSTLVNPLSSISPTTLLLLGGVALVAIMMAGREDR